MLKHLSITNYAIIESVELEFNNGLTVITGETGAGKSILLGALTLVLGERVDTSVLNNKEKKCVVEGEFNFSKEKFTPFFDENDLDFEETNIIRREINASGKSRAFINDTPVSLNILKSLASQLINIHSQHQTLNIQNSTFQINVLDAYSKVYEEVSVYTREYNSYLQNKTELNCLIQASNNLKSDFDYISFQVKEINELALKPNEKEDIEAELQLINNAEEIKSVLEHSSITLMNSEKNLVAELKSICNSFSKIRACSAEYDILYDRLCSIGIELEDISHEITNCNSTLNFDTNNLNQLNNRISRIFSIEQKHNVSSTEEILKLAKTLQQQLDQIGSHDNDIIASRKLVDDQEKKLFDMAAKISKRRISSIDDFSKTIVSNLNQLGMSDALFKVEHKKLENLTENGIDKVDFLFTANKGVELKELNKAASGGELSRLMLSIKSILARNNNLSSIVFDEIDSGVSGEIADKMATIMKEMSKNIQVIAITHLPQVAAKGEWHYKIYKVNKNGITKTLLSHLSETERVEELAKMLSGKKMTSVARDNAKVLLKN